MFLRLSIPPRIEEERAALAGHRQAVVAEPTYGTQLQDLAIPSLKGEGRTAIAYEELPIELAGGEAVMRWWPTYRVADAMFRRILSTLDAPIALDLERPLGRSLATGRG